MNSVGMVSAYYENAYMKLLTKGDRSNPSSKRLSTFVVAGAHFAP
jgi:hypothetical protein